MTRAARQPQAWIWLLVAVAGPAGCGRNTPTTPSVVGPPAPFNASNAVRYDLTVAAGLPCEELDGSLRQIADTNLPIEVRSRTYTADATALSGSQVRLQVSGPNLAPFSFDLVRTGSGRFTNTFDDPGFVERLPNFSYLEIRGYGIETVADLESREITLPFFGAFEYCVLNSAMDLRTNNCYTTPASQRVSYSVCVSSSHRMTLTRR